MSLLVSHRGAAKPLALAFAVAIAHPARAQTEPTLAPIVISTSRFANDATPTPIGATLITAEQIQQAGISNVNEAIRQLGGVSGRQNFNGTQDFSLDLRGFGTSSDQNLVILVDGVRLSDNELTPALLSSIPIESVQRIEIVRGGNSVLYGEGATGGAIHIITQQPALKRQHAFLLAEIGSWGQQELRASLAKGWEKFSLDINTSVQRADNYRANNASKQENFSGGMEWATEAGRIGMKLDLAQQKSRFAGALTLEQFDADPRQSTRPDDFGAIDTQRYTLFGEHRWGALDLAVELAHREKTSRGTFVSAFGNFDSRYESRMTQFSPRLRHVSNAGQWRNELVAGIDLFRWTRLTNNDFAGTPASRQQASQQSHAVYAHNEIRFGNARMALGARHEVFNKDSVDPIPFTTNTYNTSQALNAWEWQGSYTIAPALNIFAKTGQSYRVANVDENGLTPTPNQPLAPQTSHDLELGATLTQGRHKASITWFDHRLKNEILFDPTAGAFGANVNLDPTRRQGLEIEASTRVTPTLAVSANVQHVQATFTEGLNAGSEIVLVPRNHVFLRLNWLPTDGQSAHIGLHWVDSQRYGGDFGNKCSTKIPAYTTLDARYARRVGAWEFSIAGSNLTDRRYFSNAFGACESGIYPDAGRQVRVSARIDF